MAAPIPTIKLPFEDDGEIQTFFPPHQEEPFEGTKRQYFDFLMGAHYPLANQVKALTQQEKEMRAAIVALLYPDGYDAEGTDRYELPGGWKLDIDRKMNVAIDEAQLSAIREEVAKLEIDPETGEVPDFDACIKTKLDFSMSGWRNLRDDVRVLLGEALTFKQGSPGFKLKEPSARATQRATDQKARSKASYDPRDGDL